MFAGGYDDPSSPDNYLLTRTYTKWYNSSIIMNIKPKCSSIYKCESETMLYNPWNEEIKINGTDGMQFHPLVKRKETISIFNPFVGRTLKFNYDEKKKKVYKFKIDEYEYHNS